MPLQNRKKTHSCIIYTVVSANLHKFYTKSLDFVQIMRCQCRKTRGMNSPNETNLQDNEKEHNQSHTLPKIIRRSPRHVD